MESTLAEDAFLRCCQIVSDTAQGILLCDFRGKPCEPERFCEAGRRVLVAGFQPLTRSMGPGVSIKSQVEFMAQAGT